MKKTLGTIETLSGHGLRIGIVVGRFNEEITLKLLQGAVTTLEKKGVKDIYAVWVPGAFEIPLMLQNLARTEKFDSLIALGAVIRGETPHFDYVCQESSRGVMEVSLKESIPIAFGILTTDNSKQALDRVGGRHGHKGSEAALVAIEMARSMKPSNKKAYGLSA